MVAAGFNNEGGNVAHRGLMRDAPFSLEDSVPFNMTNAYPFTSTVFTSAFTGRPAVSAFHDAWGYYPGAEFTSRGPGYVPASMKWVTKQWDASAVIPSTALYGIKAPGYVGTGAGQQELRFDCASTNTGRLGCYWFGAGVGAGYDGGSGNPGDVMGQYGWHAQILDQTLYTATVKIWNSMLQADQAFLTNKTTSFISDTVTFSYVMTENQGSILDLLACVPLDTTKQEYVAGSATNGAVGLGTTCGVAAQMAASKQPLTGVASAPAATVQSVVWMGTVPTMEGDSFSFNVKPNLLKTQLNNSAILFNQGAYWTTLPAATVNVAPLYLNYLPIVMAPGDVPPFKR
jgi:hypothetical protein